MIIGTAIFDLHLPGVNSLKEKRRRIKSLLARIRSKYNVSAAEVSMNDSHRSARIGIAVVSNDRSMVDRVISRIALMVEHEPEINMTDYRVEIL